MLRAMPVVPISPTRPRLPEWFRRSLPANAESAVTNDIVRKHGLVTVCEEATCPNRQECWSKRAATFMLMGDHCTRTCTFCDVKWAKAPAPLDASEPERLAEAIAELGLRFAVVTSVNRDDLADGGAPHFAAAIAAIRRRSPGTLIEVLTPDFQGRPADIETVVRARPDVYNHNLETIPRLYPTVRPQARYQRSLDLLALVKRSDPSIVTKSGIMVGLGETDDEVRRLMDDLRRHRVDVFTVGQYLRPSLEHHDIIRFVTPEQFAIYERWGREAGFKYTASGPYVRSSYFAEEVMAGAVALPPATEA
ncbi:MAG: lipoyl synthase [Planctomycetes bacterium]|nr:lipoyl synthase [Planctomycetota bacterium]